MPWEVGNVKAWSVPRMASPFGASGPASWLDRFAPDFFLGISRSPNPLRVSQVFHYSGSRRVASGVRSESGTRLTGGTFHDPASIDSLGQESLPPVPGI